MKQRPLIITSVDGAIPLRLLVYEQRRRGWPKLTLEGDGTWWLMHPAPLPIASSEDDRSVNTHEQQA